MKTRDFLKAIGVLSFAGMLFSGSLAAGELFPSGIVCTTCSSSSLFGLPVCVYGLAMYTLIFALSVYGYYKGS